MQGNWTNEVFCFCVFFLGWHLAAAVTCRLHLVSLTWWAFDNTGIPDAWMDQPHPQSKAKASTHLISHSFSPVTRKRPLHHTRLQTKSQHAKRTKNVKAFFFCIVKCMATIMWSLQPYMDGFFSSFLHSSSSCHPESRPLALTAWLVPDRRLSWPPRVV